MDLYTLILRYTTLLLIVFRVLAHYYMNYLHMSIVMGIYMFSESDDIGARSPWTSCAVVDARCRGDSGQTHDFTYNWVIYCMMCEL